MLITYNYYNIDSHSIKMIDYMDRLVTLRACLHEGGGLQVDEVTRLGDSFRSKPCFYDKNENQNSF